MVNVIGVRFQQNGKMYYFDADSFTPVLGDYVIVNTVRGHDLGEVVMGVHSMEQEQLKMSLQKMIRHATEQDISHAQENRSRETEAFSICQKKIAEHQLEMKLVSVECAFDNSKMQFYFTANGRVDFRALVKDLASVFKTRIELRQIGVRDEARMLGGLGPCGRPICCGSFLNDFQPVSIKMAKEQNLSLNPTKISGVCGRLMCCLKYEQDHYEQTRKRMPRVGREVMTPDGIGTVTDLNIVKESVSVRIMKGDEGEIRDYPLDQIVRSANKDSSQADALPKNPDDTADHGNIQSPENEAEGLSVLTEEDRETTMIAASADPESESESPRKPAEDRRKQQAQRPARSPQRNGENRPKQKNASGRSSDEEAAPRISGQVVRRENTKNKAAKPRKAAGAPDGTNERKEPAGSAEQKTEPQRISQPAANKGKGWAAALEQALKAADGKDNS